MATRKVKNLNRLPSRWTGGPARLDVLHRDYELLARLEVAIIHQAGGQASFEVDVPRLFRQSIDEVIDPVRSRRFLLSELEKTEKTYIGTKIEILLRNHLALERGLRLDVIIDDVEVDIKNTIKTGWMIPREAIGHPCILIRTDDTKAKCWFGLVVIRPEMLGGKNRDSKSQITASDMQHVHWLLYNHDYPANFWQSVSVADRTEILKPKGGNDRLINLFELFSRRPIGRDVILAVTPQDDPMRRLRKNGGARDKLQASGMALLSGKYDHSLIAALELPTCRSDEFISIRPDTEAERKTLKQAGVWSQA